MPMSHFGCIKVRVEVTRISSLCINFELLVESRQVENITESDLYVDLLCIQTDDFY